MSQYWERVERQRLLIRAEQWARSVKAIHAHSLSSMWYDNTNNDESVIDVEYNGGLVKREIISSGQKIWFGKRLQGEELIDAYERVN